MPRQQRPNQKRRGPPVRAERRRTTPNSPSVAPAPIAPTRAQRGRTGDAATRRDTGGWIYGRHAVAAALANPARRCRRLVALRETEAEARTLLGAARARLPEGLAPEILDRGHLELMLPEGAVHQGLALQADALAPTFLEDLLAELPPDPAVAPAVVVALDQVSDPHNVGAILRSAAAFGARAVLVPEHGTPPVTAALAKAASGALEQVPLIRVTNLVRALDLLKTVGFWTVGLDEDAEQMLAALDLSGRIALVLGGEGEGLRRLTRERCDLLARLPTGDRLASLNVSNAAAIALYEIARRQR
jgi:23S rRNA (guanosine2251-2'-O)-methyltransferase